MRMRRLMRAEVSSDGMAAFLEGHIVLASLPVPDRWRLARQIELVSLAVTDSLDESNQLKGAVIFPLTAILSLFATTEDGQTVEICPMGCEGIAGVDAALRTDAQPLSTTVVQVPGSALRMDASCFSREVDQSPALNRCVRRYIGFLFGQMQLSTACNRHHTLEARCAKRLLTAQDLNGSQVVFLTQEQLAQILGASRQSVDRVLQGLSEQEAIQLRRGRIEILNRPRLRAHACNCYLMNRREMAALAGTV
jgi:CRP-like cAMP-binding protein